MSFHSFEFAVFLAVVLVAYFALVNQRNARYTLLLAASWVFYGAYEPWYLVLLVASTVLDYVTGNKIHASRGLRERRAWLGASLLGNLGLLGFFKYTDWLVDSLQLLMGALGLDVDLRALELSLLPRFIMHSPTPEIEASLRILVPVGISFYTFQTLSYTIDVYRGRVKPANNLLEFAVFVAFFPQLVAGPIVRASDFLPQLDLRPRFSRERLHAGLYRMALGLCKKVMIADVLGRYLVDPLYAQPEEYSALAHLVCLYAFTFQIYFDFSGYSDIAIGTAGMLGFDINENFELPYRARSIREFWRRWHISLSTWVRDYIYFPLGGSRGTEARVSRNLLVTMLIIGLWHGASILWVCYGLLQGCVMILERWLERCRGGRPFATSAARSLLSWCLTFHFIVFSCLFIRAGSPANLRAMVASFGESAPRELVGYGLLALVGGAVSHFMPPRIGAFVQRRFIALPTPVCGVLLGIVVGLVAILVVGETPYIYFQF